MSVEKKLFYETIISICFLYFMLMYYAGLCSSRRDFQSRYGMGNPVGCDPDCRDYCIGIPLPEIKVLLPNVLIKN